MRFDIGKGGVFVILLGVGALSLAVFAFGVWSGYQIGIQSQLTSAQVATAYPLAPPAATASPAAASATSPASATPRAGQAVASAPSPANSGAVAPNAAHAMAPKHQRVANAAIPSAGAPVNGAAEGESEAGAANESESSGASGGTVASAEPPTPAPRTFHRKPFNIEIQAAMDISGANQIMSRLHRLGYQPHMAPTEINGQTWYKIEIGPYATRADAAVAEAQLRQRYNAAYGAAASNSGAAASNNAAATGDRGAAPGSDSDSE